MDQVNYISFLLQTMRHWWHLEGHPAKIAMTHQKSPAQEVCLSSAKNSSQQRSISNWTP